MIQRAQEVHIIQSSSSCELPSMMHFQPTMLIPSTLASSSDSIHHFSSFHTLSNVIITNHLDSTLFHQYVCYFFYCLFSGLFLNDYQFVFLFCVCSLRQSFYFNHFFLFRYSYQQSVCFSYLSGISFIALSLVWEIEWLGLSKSRFSSASFRSLRDGTREKRLKHALSTRFPGLIGGLASRPDRPVVRSCFSRRSVPLVQLFLNPRNLPRCSFFSPFILLPSLVFHQYLCLARDTLQRAFPYHLTS